MAICKLKQLCGRILRREISSMRGNTLIEGGVVMCAVAAVAVITIGGSSIVQRIRLGSVISDVNGFSKAVVAFEAKYSGLPGDSASVTALTGATAGNANGVIDSSEALQFWKQLALSGLIKGKYDGSSANVPGVGVPKGPSENSGYNVLDPTGISLASQTVIIEFSGFNGSANNLAILTPEDAKTIDKKMDDGLPNTGIVRGVDSSGVNSCSSNPTAPTATYSTSAANAKTLGCRLRFIVRASSQADDAATTTGCQPGQSRISLGVNGKCPDGTIGKIIETCRFDSSNVGTWFISENHCQAVTCQGGRKAGEKRVLPCNSPAFIGSATIPAGVVQTCSNDGIWVTDAGTGTNGKAVNCIPDTSASCSGFATNEVRAPQACNWGQVGMLSQTCNGSTWATTSNTCTAIPCSSPGGIVGDTIPAEAPMTTSCPSGYSGTYKQTCLADGTWQITSNSCVPTTPATACTVGTTADISLGCPLGETGSNIYRCTGVLGAAGKWAPLQNTCEPITCSGDRIGSVRVVKEAPCPKNGNGVRIEVCEGEYIGDLTVNPPKGKWNPYTDSPTNTVLNTNQCATVMCDGKQDNRGFATWQHTAVGANASNTACLPGYSGTPPTRACNTGGVWAAPGGSVACVKNTCPTDTANAENAVWGTVYSKTSDAKGKCSWPDYEGAPTRDCDLTPTVGSSAVWSSGSKGICRPSLLPVKSSNLVLWLDAAETTSLYSDATCATPIKETAGANGVACWQDKSAPGSTKNATQATPASMATYVTNGMNGKPVIRFDGSNDYLGLPNNIIANGNSAYSAFLTVRPYSFANYGGILNFGTFSVDNQSLSFRFHNDAGFNNFWWNNDLWAPAGTFVTSTNYIISFVYSTSTGRAMFKNGASVSTNSNTNLNLLNASLGAVGRTNGSNNEYLNGDIAEILVYNSTLTTGDRADVEIYLANKWGISIAPPVTGASLWLDAADSSSVFTATNCSGAISNGSAVGCWKDKTNTVSGFISGNSPTYNSGGSGAANVRFNGTSNYLYSSTAGAYNYSGTAAYTFIAALKENSNTVTEQTIFGRYNQGVEGQYRFSTYNGFYQVIREQPPYGYFGAIPTNTSQGQIITHTWDSLYERLFVNGVYDGGMYIGGVPSNNAASLLGAHYNNGTPYKFLNADMYEFLVYPSGLSSSQRVAVEMYLARKWGITLPTLPPVVAGMTLWLDADDNSVLKGNADCLNSGLPANAATIGCWMDKSRQGLNVTAGSAPTYLTNAQNGRAVVNFNGSSNYLTRASVPYSSIASANAATLFAVQKYTSYPVKGTTTFWWNNGGDWGDPRFNLSALEVSTITFDFGNCCPTPGSRLAGTPSNFNGNFSIVNATRNPDNTQYIYVNGSLLTSGGSYSNTLSGTGPIAIGSIPFYTSYAFPGNIAEVSVYNRALSPSERCQMESYYSAKWGISTAACSVAATAAVSGGLVLWLDANDSTTLFTSNGCITGQNPSTTATIGCWKDKSGNLNHATQATSANRPAYTTNIMNNKPVIRFNGSSSYITAPTSVMQSMSAGTATGSTVFLVAKTTVIQNSSIFASYPYTNPGELWFNSHLPFGGGNLIWDNGVCCSGSARINVAWGGSVNTPYVWTFNTDGTISQNVWRNGVNIATKSNSELPSYGNTRYLDFGVIRSGSLYYNGDLAEILIYNRALGSAERQLVESYLGTKWGIVVSPVGQISGLKVWLDANDITTLYQNSNCTSTPVTASAQSVACWKDKSGNNYNAIVSAAANQPTYVTNVQNSLPVIRFDGSNDYLLDTLGTNITSATLSYFIVWKRTAFVAEGSIINFLASGATNDWDNTASLAGFWEGHTGQTQIGPERNGPQLSTMAVHPGNAVPFIGEAIFDGTNETTYINGVAQSAVASSGNFNINNITIAARSNGPSFFYNGDVSEIVIYNTALSTANRQAVETYLGNKWGITINPPPSTGIQLWLDANDYSSLFTNSNCSSGSFPVNSNTIACWKDKSGNGSNAVAGGGAAYTTGVLNGRPVARFNGTNTNYFTIANTNLTASMGVNNTTFIVASTASVKAQEILSTGTASPRYTIHNPYSDGIFYWDYGNCCSSPGRLQVAWGGSTGTAYVWTLNAVNSASQNIWRNGVLIATAATSSTLGGYAGYLYIANPPTSWGGDIGEILIYNTALSNTERSNVQRYLGAKWGISVP